MENENKELVEKELQENIDEEAEQVETNEIEVVEEVVEEQQEVEEEYVGKKVTTSIRYDYKTMKYYNMYNAAVRRKVPLIYLIFGIVTIGLCVYTAVTTFMSPKEDPETSMLGNYLIIAFMAAFAFYFIKQSLTFEKFVDKQIATHFAMHKVAKQRIEIREDKITLIPENKPEESFSYDWALISSIEEIDEYFFLFIGKQPLIIDKDPNMMVEGTYEQMLEIFDEKIETKPYKRYTKKVVKTPITYIHQDDLENDENAVEVEAVESEETND